MALLQVITKHCPILNVNILGSGDRSYAALHCAAYRGDNEIIDWLIQRAADINVKDAWGETPIFYAIDNSQTETAIKLLHSGANIYTRNDTGESVLKKVIEK